MGKIDKEKQDSQTKYKKLDDEELIAITTVDKNDYTPKGVELARSELANRNISIEQQKKKAEIIIKKRELGKKEAEKKSLTKRQKVFFILLPVIGFYYSIWVPKDWKKRRKEAKKFQNIGLLLWLGFFLLLWLFSWLKGL